ncbi:MAG TPA: carbon monoxide dehydrogenase subunit G [Bryobacteraceae bacterium]|nr:carbon monoxide dehydrogenase subunit G [Bryobacteraceae bacterium]
MKISGSQRLPFPPDQSYALMQDPEALARAIPGCESLEQTGENEYRMKMKMALAAFSGAFEGKVRISEQQPPSSFRLDVEGSGKIGFVKGGGVLKLEPSETETVVNYDGDVQVGGTIAAVGQRLIEGAAKSMIQRFFEKLAAS